MRPLSRSLSLAPICLLPLACAASTNGPAPMGASPVAASTAAAAPSSAEPAQDEPAPPGAAPTEPASPPPSPEGNVAPTLEDGRPADPKRALPQVSVRHVGMHVGGGSNSAEEKQPFLRALEAVQTPVLLCYRLVEQPMAGGTFGVDLLVPLEGGAPVIKGTRQKLGGADFVSCMERALTGAKFSPPRRATMVSYSLRFDVVDVTRR